MPFPIPSARIVQLASVRPLENLLGKNGCCVRGRILAFELGASVADDTTDIKTTEK